MPRLHPDPYAHTAGGPRWPDTMLEAQTGQAKMQGDWSATVIQPSQAYTRCPGRLSCAHPLLDAH